MNSPYEKGDHLNVDIKGLSGFKNQAEIHKHIEKLEKQMKKAANDLDFEEATKLRDEIRRLEKEAMIFGEVV
jgi:excinuclease ABC subunit B